MSTDPFKVPNVLIVEDEMILRMRAVDIVEDAGFCPVEAVNADEAISVLESRSDISLLLTDIQMPGSIDGLKLAHAVHERWPSIKIILVSGQVKPSEAERPANSRFFGKPLGVEQMIAELQAMVGAGALQIVPIVGLSIHELATNAAKYGALSCPEGRVLVSWNVGTAGLQMDWQEVGGPPVRTPAREGFGSRFVRQMLAKKGGSIRTEWLEAGVVHKIVLPTH